MTVELEFRASVSQAVQGLSSVNKNLQTTVQSANATTAALKDTGDSVATLTTQVNTLNAAQTQSTAAVGQANATNLSATDIMGGVAKASALLTTEIALVSKAFDFARDAAQKFGDLDTVSKIDEMTTTFEGLGSVLATTPIAGRDFLEWMGRAAQGAKSSAQLIALLTTELQVYAGTLDAVTALQVIGNIADAERIATLEKLRQQVTTVADATDLLRAANRKQYDEYQSQKQSGYIEYAINQAASKGITSAPTRDIGGRGSPGQAVVINPGAAPEVFIPDQPGTFYPNVAGAAGGGASGGGTINVNVSVNAGAFLGNRGDAIQLGNQLAPLVARGLGRSGATPNGGNTRA